MLKKIFVVLLVYVAVTSLYAAGKKVDKIEKEYRTNQVKCEKISDASTDTNQIGPTLILGYDQSSRENSIYSFMYFVPTISPTLVEMQISDDSEQMGRFVSYDYQQHGTRFTAVTTFEMTGQGFYNNVFDPKNAIRWNAKVQDSPKKLRKVLEYIKFKGEGVGRIEITGEIENGKKQVNQVNIKFDHAGTSPVTIGIYDIKRKNDRYNYENAQNRIIARINELTFNRTSDQPRMAIELDSISNSEEKAGFLACLKGAIANLMIKPIKITDEGNQSMMNFGLAIAEKQGSFTFPKAKNLKQNEQMKENFALNDKKTDTFRTDQGG